MRSIGGPTSATTCGNGGKSVEIKFPFNGWEARPHQKRLWNYLEQGGKRALAVWHRRAGKDEVCLHRTAVAMHERPGNYWHALPEYSQGRKAIWTAINAHTGKRRIDEVFPPQLRSTVNDTEMFIRMKNGSTWTIIGSDRYDSTVGAGVAGIVYSEFALSNPSAWAFHRPMLEENNGWAIFITTPRGHNHAKAMFDYAHTRQEGDRGWFCERLTARDTGALTEDQLEEALEEYRSLYGMDVGTAQFQQEYECSWNAAVLGAFYALEIADVRREDRVTDKIEAMRNRMVHRAWDLGICDDTSIWWFQYQPNGQCYILDCVSASGVGVEYFAAEVEARRKAYGWKDGDDWVPPDAKVKEWGSGRTRIETMRELGLRPNLIPQSTIADGINAARRLLPVCVFHLRCKEGIEALEQYRREWNDEAKTFRASAVHDWCSHYADAFRYLSLSRHDDIRKVVRRPQLRSGLVIPPPREYPASRGMVF